MNWYLKCFRQYADFEGRARRKEFWMYSLFNFAIYAVLMLIAATFYINGYPSMMMAVGGLASLYSLATLVPSLAVTFRRIHDTGRHGYMFSVGFIPIVGLIWLLILLCQDSQSDSNNWGKNPKEEDLKVNEELAAPNTSTAGMNFKETVLKPLKQYTDFKGRADKKEFWTFTFICAIITNALALIMTTVSYFTYDTTWASIGYCVCAGFILATLAPSLAVSARRLHDIGQSGWMVLVSLIPVAGVIWLVRLLCKEGQAECNKWGSKPKKSPKQIISDDNEADAVTDDNSSVAEIPTEAVQI